MVEVRNGTVGVVLAAVPDLCQIARNLRTFSWVQNGERQERCGIVPWPVPPKTSNNIIQKGLAFDREQSGTVTVPGRDAPSGFCPAGRMAEMGLWWWRRTTPDNAMEDPDVKAHRYPTRHSVFGFAAQ